MYEWTEGERLGRFAQDGVTRISERTYRSIEALAMSGRVPRDLFIFERRRTGLVVRLGPYAGLFRLEETVVELLPNIGSTREESRAYLWDMVNGADVVPRVLREDAAQVTSHESLATFVIDAFVRATERLARCGLVGTYERTSRNRGVIRGAIDWQATLAKTYGRRDQFFTKADDWTNERAAHRLLKRALLVARRHEAYRNRADRLLVSTFRSIDETGRIDPLVAPPNETYERALHYARLLLSDTDTRFIRGRDALPSALIRLPHLFERYACRTVAKAYEANGWTASFQESTHSLVDGHFTLRPDLVVRKGGDVIVCDAKWKKVSASRGRSYGVDRNDMYQLHAYAERYGARDVVLLYPSAQREANKLAFANERVTFHLHFLPGGMDEMPLSSFERRKNVKR